MQGYYGETVTFKVSSFRDIMGRPLSHLRLVHVGLLQGESLLRLAHAGLLWGDGHF